MARAGGRVAVAGVVSRVTGFARTLVLAAVLGAGVVGDAYNGANNLPNMVYELLLGSVFASAVVPLLARARRHGRKRSREFTQRLLLAALIALAVVTVVTVACAAPIVRVFVTDPGQRHLTVVFAYLLLPEIFFYGVTVLASAVLNVRDSFTAAAWAPVVNNVLVLVTCAVFVALPGPVILTPATMTTGQVATLGVGTLAGIAGQAAWTVAALRRTGFRWSWRVRPIPYTWRPVRRAVPLLGWLLGYALISQAGVAVTMRIAFDHHGVSVYTYADLLFQVPYGILAVSLLTVLMPRLSRSAAAGDRAAVLADLGRGARYLTVALIPMTVAMVLLGPIVCTLVFTGRVDPAGARLIGITIASSAFGLAPFALVMLQMRIFYACNDTRTPTLLNLTMVTVKITTIAVAATVLPDRAVVVMLSVAASLSYLAGAVAGHILLRRRYGLLGFSTVTGTFNRTAAATVIAGTGCLATVALLEHTRTGPVAGQLVTLGGGTLVGSIAFLAAAKMIGIPEIRTARALLTP
ncbi:murein biosynthesis integral membrane protein MurJ [Nocardia sp. alder85J]|uniref:murein biosynthesis integral membrane protein MurJ n=1 Tax=Nocardia sp. alder85J TaxID=2862949 RepID=UPI001CD5694F|nr:murein biosynthesis integral membrane protein MurJ [Nocardia sp. alder85J]MCX4099240.1 murein biosynthesis integral membrane protein MurJ [Nocardia sp. alder85J]